MSTAGWRRCFGVLALIAAAGTPAPSQSLPPGVACHQELSAVVGGPLSPAAIVDDQLGRSVASLGDLTSDGSIEVAVYTANGGGAVVRLLSLDPLSGVVSGQHLIGDGVGGLPVGTVVTTDGFGRSLAARPDLDGAGPAAALLAVGIPLSQSPQGGGVLLLHLDENGLVLPVGHNHPIVRLDDDTAGLSLAPGDEFGSGVVFLDGLAGPAGSVTSVAVGAQHDDAGGSESGAVWILFLDEHARPTGVQEISNVAGGMEGFVSPGDFFGSSLGAADIDGDGRSELLVQAHGHDGGGIDRGAFWVLFLDGQGVVSERVRISHGENGFPEVLEDYDAFGASIISVDDLDGDGVTDLMVGAPSDDGDGSHRGAAYLLAMESNGMVKDVVEISTGAGCFLGDLQDDDSFGEAATYLGDVDSNGRREVLIGAPGDDAAGVGSNTGSLWSLTLAEGAIGSWDSVCESLPAGVGPVLAGCGALLTGCPVQLELAQAPSSMPQYLVFGFSLLKGDFKGGVLVPSPDVVLRFPTTGAGGYKLEALWPPGIPAGTCIWIQSWIHDGGLPPGLQHSNGLKLTTP